MFFRRRFGYESRRAPKFTDVARTLSLDVEVSASGFTREMASDLSQFFKLAAAEEGAAAEGAAAEAESASSSEEEEEEMETEEEEEGAGGADVEAMEHGDAHRGSRHAFVVIPKHYGSEPDASEDEDAMLAEPVLPSMAVPAYAELSTRFPSSIGIFATALGGALGATFCGQLGEESDGGAEDYGLYDPGNRARRAFRDHAGDGDHFAAPSPGTGRGAGGGRRDSDAASVCSSAAGPRRAGQTIDPARVKERVRKVVERKRSGQAGRGKRRDKGAAKSGVKPTKGGKHAINLKDH